MSRKKLIEINKKYQDTAQASSNELFKFVSRLGQIKPSYDRDGKEIKDLVDKIKEALIKNGTKTYNVSGFTVNLSESKSYSFDTPKLLAWAKENQLPIIKTVEVLDEEALENLTYNGLIAPSQLAPFQTVKTVYKLLTKEG